MDVKLPIRLKIKLCSINHDDDETTTTKTTTTRTTTITTRTKTKTREAIDDEDAGRYSTKLGKQADDAPSVLGNVGMCVLASHQNYSSVRMHGSA